MEVVFAAAPIFEMQMQAERLSYGSTEVNESKVVMMLVFATAPIFEMQIDASRALKLLVDRSLCTQGAVAAKENYGQLICWYVGLNKSGL